MTQPHFNDLPRNRILIGDVRQQVARLPDNSVHCVITSPPYFALRDYGHAGQLGVETTVEAWAEAITDVCHDLSRVLRPDGALWLNLGDGYSRHPREGAAKKSLLLGPERVAQRLTAAGWLLRNKVIWAKRNPLPSSVRDRLSTTHEIIYFLTRNSRYYFDLDAIRESGTPGTPSRQSRPRQNGGNHYPPRTAVPDLNGGGTPRVDLNHGLSAMKAAGQDTHPLGKNPGDVWWLTTANYSGAHFATFPLALIRRPLLATCPERACTTCGRAWQRAPQRIGGRTLAIGPLRPDCPCSGGWRPGVVLDPFMGSGTVALAAEQHGRDWVGIELNPSYAALAEQRLREWRTRRDGRPPVPAEDSG